jgi:penicillin-binding protein 2
MLQIVQAAATLLNDGKKTRPHLVKEIINPETKVGRAVPVTAIADISLKKENTAIVRQALVGVNLEGTSASSFLGAAYTSGGKTGTAQVYSVRENEKYNASKLDERMRDHALFMAYAPAEDPKVVLAMVVENSGFGAQNAAPIARRIFDFLLMGQYPSEEDIAAVQIGQATKPIGKPRPVASVPWFNAIEKNPQESAPLSATPSP